MLRLWTRLFTTNCTELSKPTGGFVRGGTLCGRSCGDTSTARQIGGCEFANWAAAPAATWRQLPTSTTSLASNARRKHLDYARQSLGNRVRFGRLPNEIDLPHDSFDVVLMTDVLEHIEDDAASAITALRTCSSRRHRRRDRASVPMALFSRATHIIIIFADTASNNLPIMDWQTILKL